MTVTLSKRLQCLANKVEKGSVAADVGTDHGYIPAWLIQNNICSKVIASDIREGPLQTAIKTAANAGVDKFIDFRLCAGLNKYSADEIDIAIIAGMGGETVISILEEAPWTKEKRLIIQPQSKIPELRKWLYENGYSINDAELVYDTGRIYLVWDASGCENVKIPDSFIIDNHLIEKQDRLLGAYLEGLIKRELKVLKGMEKSRSVCREEFIQHKGFIEELKRLKEETEKWQK
ncbi:MAG: SAM-dependent methyltransferase [Oscillospiraceae bacterium]|nr:SAM-dependent methyltransferase [Oscillospiraceae bacterium]